MIYFNSFELLLDLVEHKRQQQQQETKIIKIFTKKNLHLFEMYRFQ